MEIIEFKNVITEKIYSLDGLNSKAEMTEKRIIKSEDRKINWSLIQSEKKREKKIG